MYNTQIMETFRLWGEKSNIEAKSVDKPRPLSVKINLTGVQKLLKLSRWKAKTLVGLITGQTVGCAEWGRKRIFISPFTVKHYQTREDKFYGRTSSRSFVFNPRTSECNLILKKCDNKPHFRVKFNYVMSQSQHALPNISQYLIMYRITRLTIQMKPQRKKYSHSKLTRNIVNKYFLTHFSTFIEIVFPHLLNGYVCET